MDTGYLERLKVQANRFLTVRKQVEKKLKELLKQYKKVLLFSSVMAIAYSSQEGT